jgi:hypothetical protein
VKKKPEAPGRRLGDGRDNLLARVRDIRFGLGAAPTVTEARILARAFLRGAEKLSVFDEEEEEFSDTDEGDCFQSGACMWPTK